MVEYWSMQTVFISCFTGLISRNILATDVLAELRRVPGIRIVIVAPESRTAVLRGEFGGPNVIIEGMPKPNLRGRDRAWWTLATHLLDTPTRRVQRQAKLARDGSRLDYLGSLLLGLAGRSRVVRGLFRRFAAWAVKTEEFDPLLARYRPDLVFSTDVYTPQDVKITTLARRRGVRVIGMVRSWDNVTSKTLLVFHPDRLIVNTAWIAEEAQHFGDVPRQSITVLDGVPHYDHYVPAGRTPRKEFFGRFGLDPVKPLILFTPPSDTYLKHDPVTPVVLKAVENLGAQVLVRLPLVGASELGAYRPPPNVAFDEPMNSPDFTEVHLSRDADRHLADSLYHADIVITWASTMIIDAAVFDKPIVLVGFDATPRPYAKSIRQYYDYTHQRRIIETGGVRLAQTPAELADCVRAYLADPKLDAAGRAAIRREYCGTLDGTAGHRLAEVLLAHCGDGTTMGGR